MSHLSSNVFTLDLFSFFLEGISTFINANTVLTKIFLCKNFYFLFQIFCLNVIVQNI